MSTTAQLPAPDDGFAKELADDWEAAQKAAFDHAIETTLSATTQQPAHDKWLAQHQPCGCIICICDDDERCHGCGAKHCGTHPLGVIPNAVYEARPAPDFGEPWIELATWNHLQTVDGKTIVYDASDMNEPYRSRAITCVNACAGMADPAAEIQAMREAIKEAHLQLTYASKLSAASVIHIHLHNAADKLKPFLP